MQPKDKNFRQPSEIKSDIEMWDLFRSGDQGAFLLLRQRFVKKLYRFGYKTTGNATLAKEVAVDFFVDLWLKRENLGPAASPNNYLYLAFRRRLYARIEKENRYSSLDILPDDLPETDSVSAEQLLIINEDKTRLEEKVKKAIAKLTHRQREAIHLKFFEEMSYEEIAEIMELNPQSAYNLIHRSLNALRQVFADLPVKGFTIKMALLIWYGYNTR